MYARKLKLPSSKNSYFLFGPRGTGKTFYLKHNFPNAFYVDLLHSETYVELLGNPSRIEEMISIHPTNEFVIIDEVQRIPELLNEVHRLIEHKNYRFILTGSSARSLKRKGVNLLAGRALHYTMHPLTIQELGQDFNLEKALSFGLLPSVFALEEASKYLSTYIKTYITEEILQEGLTRNIGQFARFLETASFSQGNQLNYSQIAREVGIHRKVVESYFDITEDLLIGKRIQPFVRRAKRKISTHCKFYFFDVGVYKTLRPRGPLDSEAEIDGPGLETLFYQHLRAVNDYSNLEYELFFWRSRGQIEVDFVMYGLKGLIAFEIKRKSNLQPSDFKGLKTFAQDYPEAQLYLIYGGQRRYYKDNIHVIPLVEALLSLPEILENNSPL